MSIGADFHLSRIVVVESLESHEVKTGKHVAELIEASDNARLMGLAVEYHTCEHAGEFIEFVRELTLDVSRTGRIPLLHIECHGDQTDGLEFQNGSVLSWPELSDLLVDLNRAAQFNLVAVFSACYGGHFLSRLDSIDPAPCYAMIAPTESVNPSEILAGFRTFYTTLFKTGDAGVAIDEIMQLDLQDGQWFGQQAELWYERIVIDYIEMHCTNAAMKVRSLRMLNKLRAKNVNATIGYLKRGLVQANRSNLVDKFFERYFMVDTLPENALRFHAVRARLEQRISQLSRTGRYGL